MNKSDLIKSLREKTGLDETIAAKAVNTLISQMQDTLARGEKVEIRGFGNFKVKQYKAYTGRHPKT